MGIFSRLFSKKNSLPSGCDSLQYVTGELLKRPILIHNLEYMPENPTDAVDFIVSEFEYAACLVEFPGFINYNDSLKFYTSTKKYKHSSPDWVAAIDLLFIAAIWQGIDFEDIIREKTEPLFSHDPEIAISLILHVFDSLENLAKTLFFLETGKDCKNGLACICMNRSKMCESLIEKYKANS